jgi:hypothetical protein
VYDPRRLRGPLVGLAALLVALAVGSLGLSPALRGRPRWVPEVDSSTDLEEYHRIGRRLSGLIRQGHARGGPAAERLGVMLGSSSLEWGIDPQALPAELGGRPIRWFNIHSSGANGIDLRRMAGYMTRAGLRPEVAVLCLGPSFLARGNDPLDDPTPEVEEIRSHIAGRHPMLLKEDFEDILLLPWNLAFPNRTRIGSWARDVIFDARIDLFASMGYGINALFAPESDPWSAPPWWAQGDHVPPLMIERQMKGMRRYGMFDPASYSADGLNSRALVALIRELREGGAEVIVAFFPEAEIRRRELPPEALASFDEALRRAFGTAAPPVLDMRGAMSEEYFFDTSHLNPGGRAAFTERLGRALRELHASPGSVGR